MNDMRYTAMLRKAALKSVQAAEFIPRLLKLSLQASFQLPQSGNAVIVSDLARQLINGSYESLEERDAMLEQLLGIILENFR